jgi:predicted aminopeptidase
MENSTTMTRLRRAFRLLAAAACAALLAGCETLAYYTQAVGGQLEITTRARPIDTVMYDPATSGELRAKLRTALEIREFASRELGLPNDGSYRKYADLGRPFVVWNLFSTPEFSTRPIEYCFPVTGCVSYRGYFAEADATAFGAKMRAKGYDVQVSGIPAYSTLGWFDDPLLSTFIRYPESELARLVFHELAHHVVYAKGDTVFNESFAVSVERLGVHRWLAVHKHEGDYAPFMVARERQREFVTLIAAAKVRLDKVYESGMAEPEMREAKRAGFAELRRDYEALKKRWGGYSGYDRIMGSSPGNALLASITAYSKFVPGFEKMIEAVNGDMPRFYAAVKDLAKKTKTERCQALTTIASVSSDQC